MVAVILAWVGDCAIGLDATTSVRLILRSVDERAPYTSEGGPADVSAARNRPPASTLSFTSTDPFSTVIPASVHSSAPALCSASHSSRLPILQWHPEV